LERSLTGIISRGRDGRGWNDYQTEAIAMLEQGGGLPTGYASLDRFVGGIPRKGMTILAGRPAMGKTSLLRGIIRRQVQQGHKILWFSVDQPGGDITLLEASRLAKLSADRVRGQQLSTVERHRLRESIGRFVASYREQVELHDSSLSLPKIVSGIRAAARRGLSMVAIDYIQRVNVPGIASGDNYGRVTEVARTLDDVSMELGLPVVALAQLSKEIEKRGNKRPMLGDLRESGYLEQDAKTVLGIYRDDYYAKQEDRPSQHEGVAEVLILKNKLGPTGKVDLKWHDAYADFEELAASWQEQQAVRFL
ncbi:MAG TPA: DnaB-like helicase C-terminal domain-containing protein, partial [Trueperaceae bacterium]